MTRREKAFKNMLVDHKNVNNALGIDNTPVGRGLPKKKVKEDTSKKKK